MLDGRFGTNKKIKALRNSGTMPKTVNENDQPWASIPIGRTKGAINQATVTAKEPATAVAVAL